MNDQNDFDFLAAFSKREVTNALDAVSTVVFAVGLTRESFLNLTESDYEKLMHRYALTELEIHLAWTCWHRVLPLSGQASAVKQSYPWGLSNLSAIVATRRNGQSGMSETPTA